MKYSFATIAQFFQNKIKCNVIYFAKEQRMSDLSRDYIK